MQDIACEYDGSDYDEFNVQIADKHILRCCLEKVFSEWAALVDKSVKMSGVSFFKAAVNPGAPGHLLRAEDDVAETCLHPDLLCPSGYSLVDYVATMLDIQSAR